MLVLTRKLQEKIVIGSDITLTILRIKGNTVRVGIDAPREVRVVRGELPLHEETAASETESEETAHVLEFELNLSDLGLDEEENEGDAPAWRRTAPLGRRLPATQAAM
ncbi:carbon storage regulator [Lignipirellula cremea]|uniref:Translational regulator CsrA n=1 Tax=Lignipirellula cremea TaxID=2528010 RepID=A0A518E1E6_9BACT|nr:carbon storage regulator [Lignipirellula cremea]QDU97902.1 hypothetical protein Pla8534_57600 [Lignipirellula cremea]